MADIYGMLMDGMQSARAGADAKKKRGLAALVGQAYSAPQADRQGLLGQIATGDPTLAANTQKTISDWDDAKQASLTRSAQLILAAPEESRPQIWAQIVASGEIPGLSPQYDPVKVPEMAQKIVAMGAGEAEQFTLSPGSKRFDASGRMLAEVPFAPANASLVSVPDGQGGMVQMEYDPRTRQFALPQYPGQSQQPAQAAPQGADVMGDAFRGAMGPQGVQSLVKSLAGQFGGQVSSLQRSPADNARVGGVANSQHMAGTAGDVVVPAPQRAAFIAAARAQGLEAIDEGDHVHLELPPRGQQVAQAGRMGYTPPKAATAGAKPSALEERIRIAREQGATPEQLQRIALGSAAPRTPKTDPRMAAAELKRSREVASQDASFGEIERLVQTLEDNNNVSGWSSTLMPFGEDRNTYQSTAGQLAVLLKPLIRGPGEGTWTDKDQELLERLVPKLDNYEGTNKKVIENIRSMIASKRKGLGIGEAQAPASGGLSAEEQAELDQLRSRFGRK